MEVHTAEITLEEWRMKKSTADVDWLVLQYNGLKALEQIIDNEIQNKTLLIEVNPKMEFDEAYREFIYPLEDQLMDIDIQLVDVEEEIEQRRIELRIC